MNLISKISLVIRLGVRSVFIVLLYRFQKKIGVLKLRHKFDEYQEKGNIFLVNSTQEKSNILFKLDSKSIEILKSDANNILKNNFKFYFDRNIDVGEINWHKFYNTPQNKVLPFSVHWSEIDKNIEAGDDIKNVWELSRFYWALDLAKAYRAFSDEKYINKLNELVSIWMSNNPVNKGVNWYCGQEVSYRINNLISVLFLLGLNIKPSPVFEELIYHHLKRVIGTLSYAIAQKNNHGITEAAALFIGGAWLSNNGKNVRYKKTGDKCSKNGLKVLEKLILNLIQEDGSFSMYSINYHRVVVQWLSFVLYGIEVLGLPKLRKECNQKLEKLLRFQEIICDPITGKVPSIGANDGSYPFKLNSNAFDDFRPSNMLFRGLLLRNRIYNLFSEDLTWLNKLELEYNHKETDSNRNMDFQDFGLVLLQPSNNLRGFLRYPSFKYRPSHCDIGHFDFWFKHENILSDSGTFNYSNEELSLSNEKYHNTLVVLNSPQLRKLSSFLYLDWPMKQGGLISNTAYSSFERDYKHNRKVNFNENSCIVLDEFICPEKASIHWNLSGEKWLRVRENVFTNGKIQVEIKSMKQVEIKLQKGMRSSYYNSLEAIQQLIIVHGPGEGQIETHLKWDLLLNNNFEDNKN
ncbi:MAG: heparinase II/III family protein [Bdellovibrionaceae bacterium]|nr:heparinase II/III family protein [Pseudobdellovibrionaceae bacterium]